MSTRQILITGLVAAALLFGIAVGRRSRGAVHSFRPAPRGGSAETIARSPEVTMQLESLRQPSAKPNGFRDVDHVKQGKVLHDATLANTIRIAKVATLQRDEATRQAMLAALRKEPRRARELVAMARDQTTDPGEAAALQGILGDLH